MRRGLLADFPVTARQRLNLANWAVATLGRRVRAEGKYSAWNSEMPGHWALETSEFRLLLTEGVLLFPTDVATSCLLDVWSLRKSGKLLSVRWMPERPWEPPHIVAKAKDDGWLQALGWSPP